MRTALTNYHRLEQLLQLLSTELDHASPETATCGTSTAMDALLNDGYACFVFDLETAVSVARIPGTYGLVVEVDHIGTIPNSTRVLLDRFIRGDTLPCS